MRLNFSNNTVKILIREIAKAQQLNNLRLFKIVRALLLTAEGYEIEETARFLNVSGRTVYNWLSGFIAGGFSWLYGYHYKGRGRRSRMTGEQKRKLYEIVAEGPEKYGFDCGIWNSAMIGTVILNEFGIMYNPRYICGLLKKIGLSYQKVKFESDHLDEEKRKEWVNVTWPSVLKEAEEKNAVIIFIDEVSFAQWGSLSRTWAPKGKQPKVKTCGKRKGLKMFGAVEFFKGSFQYMETEDKFNGQSYMAFLEKVLKSYHVPVIIIEDGAKYHHSAAVKEYKTGMKEKGRLFTYRLPSYSPDYNPIEKLWKNTKKAGTHCKYFPTFESLRTAVVKIFSRYMEDAAEVICVMKKMRENAGLVPSIL